VLAGKFSLWLHRRSTLSTCCLIGAAGALCPLAFSPFHLVPVLFLSFALLVRVIALARGCGTALAFGWAFGFGYFVGGLYWIEHAFVVARRTLTPLQSNPKECPSAQQQMRALSSTNHRQSIQTQTPIRMRGRSRTPSLMQSRAPKAQN
jgi:hypothetical protein